MAQLQNYAFSSLTPVFVSEETIYSRERSASDRSLLPFRQITVAAATPQPFFLRHKSPDPRLFFDTWVMAYGKTEEVGQFATTFFNPPQPFFLRHKSPRPELFFDTWAMAYPKVEYVSPYANFFIPVIGIAVDQPDFCDHPWLEPVPIHFAASLYPFRQIYPPGVSNTVALQMFYKAPNWRIEAELDSRPPDLAAKFYPFRQITVFTPPPAGFRVMAVAAGDYMNIYRDIGDVFDLVTANDFSDSTVSFVPPGNPDNPVYGWMQQVPPNTPLFSWALATGDGLSTPRTSPRRTVL